MSVQEPSMQLLAEAAQNQIPLPDKDMLDDTRSSSLSDIDDNAESEVEAESENELSAQASGEDAGNDTEAETERLEESPDKLRKHKKVLLNAENEVTDMSITPMKVKVDPSKRDQEDDEEIEEARHEIQDATSPISSPSESADEATPPASPLSTASRKRKRGQDSSPSTKRAAMQVLKNAMGGQITKSDKDSAEFIIKNIDGKQKISGAELLDDSAAASPVEEATEDLDEAVEEDGEPAESNDEVDMEDAAPEIDANAKSEADLAKRREAADKVTNIEEQFAVFRDKMFDQHLTGIIAELASLDSDEATHSEYLLFKSDVSRQKRSRTRLSRIEFGFCARNWQHRTKAGNQVNWSDYAQSARDTRDGKVTKASDMWYQTQNARRSSEQSPDSIPLASYKRIDLVAQQTAYNTEVSLLSGIAKFKGFPAAPELVGVTAAEAEEDMKAAGLTVAAPQSHISSSISQFLRQTSAAEKQFSKVTPWAANPSYNPGIASAYAWSPARPNSPFTPANQSQQGDVPVAGGSASTILGSHAPTPQSSEIIGSSSKSKTYTGVLGETPSRMPPNSRPLSTIQDGFPPPRSRIQETVVNGPADFSSPGGIVPELRMGTA